MRFLFISAAVCLMSVSTVSVSLFAADAPASATASVTVARLAVKGMTCSNCAETITKQLKAIDGVTATRVDVNKGAAVVTYDARKVKPEALVKAINELGYKASL